MEIGASVRSADTRRLPRKGHVRPARASGMLDSKSYSASSLLSMSGGIFDGSKFPVLACFSLIRRAQGWLGGGS